MRSVKIKTINVKNYRCLKNVDVPIEDLSVLLGQNGCGKSCLLGALQLFYNTDIQIEKEDFYNEDIDEEITITISFSGLTAYEKDLFKPYLDGDELSVEKAIILTPERMVQKYHGTRYVNADFELFRNAGGTGLRSEYEKLRQKQEYSGFPSYKNKDEANVTLEQWELANKQHCVRKRDDGAVFWVPQCRKHRLEKFTKFIFVPAVQEAREQSLEQRGSILEEIMQLVVKSSLTANEEINKLQAETELKYKDLIDPSKNKSLTDLEGKLTDTLATLSQTQRLRSNGLTKQGYRLTHLGRM